MKKITILLASVFLGILMTGNLNAQNIVADSLFATNSKLDVSTIGGEVGGNFMLQSDGKIIYGGYDAGQFDFQLDMMRFDECGQLDPSFGINGVTRHKFSDRNLGYAYTLQSDGKIVCVGVQAPSNSGSQQRACVSRFNSDGSPDLTFNLTGTHPLLIAAGRFHSVQVMDNGKIVCFGDFGSGLGAGVARFMPDGSLDTTFNTDGIALFNAPSFGFFNNTRGFVLPDGKFLLSSYVSDTSGNYHFMALRLYSSGALDTTYGVGGIYYDSLIPVSPFIFSLTSAMDTNGNLLLTKSFNNTVFDILRLTPSGTLDPTFGTGGRVTYDSGATTSGIQILSNGKILIRGRSNSVQFGIGAGILFLPNGTPDEAFGPNGLRQFNFNNGTGTHSLDALLELPNGQWITAAASSSFMFKKYGNVSNFPNISQTGSELSSTGTGSFLWFLEGIAISEAINQTFTPTQNGNYTVMITDASGCKGTSSVFNVNNLGVNSNSFTSEIAIYPNPSKGVFNIQTNKAIKKGKIVISDLNGKIVDIIEFQNFENKSLDLNSLQNGVYILKITAENGIFSQKIIKQ